MCRDAFIFGGSSLYNRKTRLNWPPNLLARLTERLDARQKKEDGGGHTSKKRHPSKVWGGLGGALLSLSGAQVALQMLCAALHSPLSTHLPRRG